MEVNKELLMRWWNGYYSKKQMEETKKFEEIIEEYGVNKVIDAGVASYLLNDGSPYLILLAIRTDDLKTFFNLISEITYKKKEEKDFYEKIREIFINNILEK